MSDKPAGVGNEVLFEIVDDHIAVVTLNRPEKRNAMSVALAEALEYLVEKIEADPQIRVAILTSSNDKAFCAGADLAEIAQGKMGMATAKGGFGGFVDAARVKPWIAAVRGVALAGGCELVLASDMVVCDKGSAFGLPEVKRGLFAAAGGVHRLPRAIPRNIALEMLATGDPLPAQRAYEVGLVNRLVESDAEVLPTAIALANAISANAPLSVRQSLYVARIALEHPDKDMRKISSEANGPVMRSKDAQEGPRAFVEKRKPNWIGA